MRYLVLLFAFLPLFVISQNVLQVSEERTIYMEKIISAPDYTKAQLYSKALSWTADTFNSPEDVMSFNDSEVGKIKGTFLADYKISMASFAFSHTFMIQVKEGRLKIEFDNIFNTEGGYTLEAYLLKKNNTFRPMYSGLTSDVQYILNDLINKLEKFINESASKEDDW